MRWTIVMVPVALVSAQVSCHSNRATGLDMNVPPLRHYAEKLVGASGARLHVTGCQMFDDSRKGYCLVEGASKDLSALVSGLKLAEGSPQRVYGRLSCLSLSDYGVSSAATPGESFTARAGIHRYTARGPLPGNTDNVRLVTVYAGKHAACLEMEYPYG